MTKTSTGNFFEDFTPGQQLIHATPRTLTSGDASLYTALYGSRFALQSADSFAATCGLSQAPLDDLLVFHTVFGKTVPDVSLNAVANLGYAEGRFGVPVYPGDSLTASSEVIGLKENSSCPMFAGSWCRNGIRPVRPRQRWCLNWQRLSVQTVWQISPDSPVKVMIRRWPDRPTCLKIMPRVRESIMSMA